MRKSVSGVRLVVVGTILLLAACSGDGSGPVTDGDAESGDGAVETETPDAEEEGADADPVMEGETAEEADEPEIEPEAEEVGPLDPPHRPSTELGFDPPVRESRGAPPTEEEITAFTKKVTAFFKETSFFDWVYRTNHGWDRSADPEKFDYKLWWQDTTMRREGDTIVFTHVGRAENILKRTIKVMDAAASGHHLTGDARMGEVARQQMNGVVALSLGMEFEREPTPVKYLQARAVFNQNHAYTVDGRSVRIDYSPMYWDETHETWYKWNVHVFEIPDNPAFGQVWVSNMRSKDDVPYIFISLDVITRLYHQTTDPALREAARRYLEYMRGFSRSIVDNDWYILTKYRDGLVDIARDYTKEDHPEADLGTFVHWKVLFGPDAECTAQLGSILTGYGIPGDRGDCGGGSLDTPGWSFEKMAFNGNYFNYNIYTYFHIGAMTAAHVWGRTDLAASLMNGLVARFDAYRDDPGLPNKDDKEYATDRVGWLISAAAYGYPLDAEEARDIMQWYADSSDWYRAWPHWDPWSSLADGEELSGWDPPRNKTEEDGQGGTITTFYVRLDEMPYVFEYCDSPLKDKGVRFIDCSILADPARW